jgi:hypothetical protein
VCSERKRLETIAQNQKLLENLNLPGAAAQTARVQRSSFVASSDSKPKPKSKKKRPAPVPRGEAVLRPRRESKRLKKLEADVGETEKILEVREVLLLSRLSVYPDFVGSDSELGGKSRGRASC